MPQFGDYLGDIIIVDDTPANLSVLTAILQKEGYRVRPAINGETAIKAANAAPPDLILLDIRMPGMDGFQVCQKLKSSDRTKDIPVIFISALTDIGDKIKAYEMGGVDYVTKPFEATEVQLRVRNHITISTQRKEIEQLSAIKGHLIDTVSHNMKSPLSIVSACADLLKTGKTENELYVGNQLLEAANWMNNLLDSFLDLNRIQSGLILDFQEIPVDSFVRGVADRLEFYANSKNITLGIRTSPIELTIISDPDYLGEAISNLISNAIKYTSESGSVTIEIYDTGDCTTFEVIDQSDGIAQEDLEHIFEKLFRIPQDDESSPYGIGRVLSITSSIVEQLNGSIHVESKVGEGSRFQIMIPHLEQNQIVE